MSQYKYIPSMNLAGLQDLHHENMFRLSHAEVLQFAKERIVSGDEEYICFAIGKILCRQIDSEQRVLLSRWICSMLGDYNAYSSWFVKWNPDFVWKNNASHSKARECFQYGRIQWIDTLIRAVS